MNAPDTLARFRPPVTPAHVSALPRISPELGRIQSILRKRNSSDGLNLPLSPYYYLQCSDAPEARAVLSAYYSIPRSLRKSLTIEAYCAAAGVSPWRLLEVITGTVARISAQSSALVHAISHPGVVDNLITRALHADDQFAAKYHEMLHKAAGFLPTPRGAQTTITVQQNASARADAASLAAASPTALADAPAPEQTIRRLVEKFQAGASERRAALPPSSAVPMPIPRGAPVPEAEREHADNVVEIPTRDSDTEAEDESETSVFLDDDEE